MVHGARVDPARSGRGRGDSSPSEDSMGEGRPTVAVLGGTGDLGSGLARRWARAGYPLVIGSRTAEKAEAAAAELNARSGRGDVRGIANPDAAAAADIVVMTVP